MDDALKYLEAVLPPTGLRAVAFYDASADRFKHRFCRTNEEVIKQVEALEQAGVQSWIALATYANRRDGRKAENTLELRTLFLDIDYKTCESPEAGDADLQRLADKIGEPTFTVSSGGGIHAYWQLTHPISTNDWLPLALAFKATWLELGIHGDAKVSADAARVLRLPGTYNRKADYGEPRLVRVRTWSGVQYEPDEIAKKFTAPRPRVIPLRVDDIPQGLRVDNADLAGGLAYDEEAELKPILLKCRQMQWVWNNKAHLPEPIWYGVLGLLGYVKDGRKWAHWLSKHDSRYDEAKTDAKFDQAQAKFGGPTTCAYFREYNPKGCEGCPFNITSPIQLGREEVKSVEPDFTVKALTVDADGRVVDVEKPYQPVVPVPDGFKYDGKYTYRVVRDEETGLPRDEMIFAGFICLERIIVSQVGGAKVRGVRQIDSNGASQIYVHALGQDPARISVPASALRDKRDFSKKLGGAIPMDPKNIGHLLALMNKYEAAISAASKWSVAAAQMGWQEDGTFLIGSTLYKPEGDPQVDAPINSSLQGLAHSYMPAGDLDTWKRATQIYNYPKAEPYQFALCYGAAGLFLPHTREAGVLLSLYSQGSAKGKSTAGRAALSWWGDPQATKCQTTDTVNNIFRKASQRKNMPLLIDEITARTPAQVEEIVYDLCQGREKGRMTASLEVREPLPPWALPVISTGNASIRGKLVSNRGDAQGTLARLLEIPVDLSYAKNLDNSVDRRRLISSGFDDNYGHAGPELVLAYMRNRASCERVLDSISRKLDEALGHEPTYRFWIASCAAALTVCAVANDAGLLSYDFQRLLAWTIRMLRAQKVEAAAAIAGPDDIIGQFLEINANRMVQVRNVPSPMGVRETVYADSVRGSTLVGRVDIPRGVMHVSRTAFVEFCMARGFDASAFEHNAQEQDPGSGQTLLVAGAPTKRVSLGAGAPSLPSTRNWCLQFNLNHPALREYAEGAGATLAPAAHLRVV